MTSLAEVLISKAEKREAFFGIIGLGYVGLPLAVELANAGFRVIGFDVSRRVVDGLNAGKSHVKDISEAQLNAVRAKGLFTATTDGSKLAACDAISICVPTPLSKFKDPDVSYIVAATETVKKVLRPGQAIILESTTYPGTTREIMLPALEATGLKAGRDFFLAFSPERVDPGNPVYHTRNTPKVVGGITDDCRRVVAALYRPAIDTLVEVSTTEAAELATANDSTIISAPMPGVNEVVGDASAPPSAPSEAPITIVSSETRLALTPIAVATSRWCVTAVIWRPSAVRPRNQRRPKKQTIATTGSTSSW